VDVPAKLSARARLLDTGHHRKTDAHDAHAVAVVAVRPKTLRVLAHDADLEVLRMLVDRRDELSKAKVQAVNRLHRLLSELVRQVSSLGEVSRTGARIEVTGADALRASARLPVGSSQQPATGPSAPCWRRNRPAPRRAKANPELPGGRSRQETSLPNTSTSTRRRPSLDSSCHFSRKPCQSSLYQRA
jgi:hypothetical protein